VTLLRGQVALVTGASRGIGAAAELLAAEGAQVLRVARTLTSGGVRFHDFPCDLTQAEQVSELAARVVDAHGPRRSPLWPLGRHTC